MRVPGRRAGIGGATVSIVAERAIDIARLRRRLAQMVSAPHRR